VTDVYSIPGMVRFYRPTYVTIIVGLTITPVPGATYRNAIGDAAKQAVADFITALPIGGFIDLSRLYQPIEESSPIIDVIALTIARQGSSLGSSDIQLTLAEAAVCTIDNVALAVV
jgi:uncharacterized phage protein gp47/JayE